MAICTACNGTRFQEWEEDGRLIRDACYHCGNTGELSEEEVFHDRLMQVASTLAYQIESDYRKDCDSDPEGEGYEFRAAEHMMRTHDYFMGRVYDRQYEIAGQLVELDHSSQELLVAWHEAPIEGRR